MSRMNEAAAPPVLSASNGLWQWLAETQASIAFTTYQAGRLFLIGTKPDGGMRAHERRVDHCQGLWTDGGSLWLSSRSILWRFANDLPPGERTERGATRRFVPREGRVTGAIDIHDVA